MAKNEKTGSKVASLASKWLKNPKKLTLKEIKSICASNLTQAPDKKKVKQKIKKKSVIKKKTKK